ncbi:unnamed protein product [Symbiodinium microadriaticum]|nr:unnamed protein product [Symbiodinium microadriaticum]
MRHLQAGLQAEHRSYLLRADVRFDRDRELCLLPCAEGAHGRPPVLGMHGRLPAYRKWHLRAFRMPDRAR